MIFDKDTMTFEKALKMVLILLSNHSRDDATPELIKKQCEFILSLAPHLEAQVGNLVHEVQKHFGVMAYSGRLVGGQHVNWLTEGRASQIKWVYWDAYREYSLSSPQDVKLEMNRDMTKVLSRLGDPLKAGSWSVKGLVMGSVQSGKTANYIGLMAKAMDAGYKVVVVLTGIHESLRAQTQLRINDGVLGYAPVIQAGRIVQQPNLAPLPAAHPKPICLTTANSDFRAAVAQVGIQQLISSDVPLVFVVKKCAPILKNLYSWLSANANSIADESTAQGISARKIIPGVPALIIDDEADQASIDTEGEVTDDGETVGDPTTINALTRGICNLFEKNSYVAFTATPFANILIHDELEGGMHSLLSGAEVKEKERLTKRLEELKCEVGRDGEISQLERRISSLGLKLFIGQDLFPKDFVYSLKPPSNYFGPEKIFGNPIDESGNEAVPALPIVFSVDDVWGGTPGENEGFCFRGHGRSHSPSGLPDSLKEAILSFFLCSAERNLRGSGKGVNSMLIHVSRFTDVQSKVKKLVSEYVGRMCEAIRNYEDPNETPEGRQLHQVFIGKTSETGMNFISDMVTEIVPGYVRKNGSREFLELYSEVRRIAQSSRGFDVIELHGKSDDALVYVDKADYSVIVVGGNKLSRGLTLDGLIVSYYLRMSDSYDTLLQMGRWFGYREDYLDLIRIYTHKSLINRFKHLSVAITLLRQEFDDLANTPGATPKDFGLKILCHPEMNVTSLLKLRHGVKQRVSFSGEASETTVFSVEDSDFNFGVISDLAINIEKSGIEKCRIQNEATVWFSEVHYEVILSFLSKFRWGVGNSTERNKPMTAYIEKMVLENQELGTWDVFFRSSNAKGGGQDPDLAKLARDLPIANCGSGIFEDLKFPFVRARQNDDGHEKFALKSTGGSAEESICLTSEELLRAKSLAVLWAEEKARADGVDFDVNAKDSVTVSPRAYRHARSPKKGRIVIYPIAIYDKKSGTLATKKVFWGARVSFPASSKPGYVEFVVNQAFLEEIENENGAA